MRKTGRLHWPWLVLAVVLAGAGILCLGTRRSETSNSMSMKIAGPLQQWLLAHGILETNSAAAAERHDGVPRPSQKLTAARPWIRQKNGYTAMARVHIFVRKAAHVLEYGVFGLLLAAMLYHFLGQKLGWCFVWGSILCAGGFACLDEFLQGLIGRSSRWTDVLLDTAGAAAATLCSALFLAWRKRRGTGTAAGVSPRGGSLRHPGRDSGEG